MLRILPHLLTSGAQSTQMAFTWDDWDTEAVEERPDDALMQAMQPVSDRGIVALTIGMAEWVVYRFAPFDTDPLPSQFLEAAWAAEADWRYLAEKWDGMVDIEQWRGPVRGPLSACMMAVDEVVSAGRTGEDVKDGALWVSNIAVHVLPDAAPFLRWRQQALRRLTVSFRRDDDPIGDPVPREALDFTSDFRPEETEALLNQFLVTLDYRRNPFLVGPDDLIEGDFTGTPYAFDLARDRVERRVT